QVIAFLSGNDIDYFVSLNLPYKVIWKTETKSVISATSVEEAMQWDVYPTYQQYDTIMHKLAADYPDICSVDTIGESINGHLILALKISDNVDLDEDEPDVFYSSNMHGNELAGYVLMLQLAEYLLINSEDGGLVQQLVDSLQIWINPLANPDGTYLGSDTIGSPTRYNSIGVDLNRNFPDPMNPNIVQTQETIEMINFMNGHNFVISANFHSGAEVVNYPWDRWYSVFHADDTWFEKISRDYADTVQHYSGTGYLTDENNGITRGAAWYVIFGGRQDYVTYEKQGREVTIELDDIKETAGAQLPLLWEYNYRSLLRYLENAFYGIHGRVVDDDNNEPVEAKIFITGHDTDSSHIYSDPESGSFVRLINTGTWDLTFSADGYNTSTITFEVTDARAQLYREVRLIKTSSGIPENLTARMRIWPVPARDYLEIDLPEQYTGSCEVSFITLSGKQFLTRIMNPGEEHHLSLSTDNLPNGFYIVIVKDIKTRNIITGRVIIE
ncbi:MAG: hypothetical protein K8R35_07265, partial [Bacteroidales bacterium]|nr:hypothetical protein [Bacteroidales bacterium]